MVILIHFWIILCLICYFDWPISLLLFSCFLIWSIFSQLWSLKQRDFPLFHLRMFLPFIYLFPMLTPSIVLAFLSVLHLLLFNFSLPLSSAKKTLLFKVLLIHSEPLVIIFLLPSTLQVLLLYRLFFINAHTNLTW